VPRQLPEDDLIATYRQTVRTLYTWVSRRVGGDTALAEDLVQETWMRALDAWPARGVPDQPLAWLMRVARNVLVSHFRRTQPQLVDPATLDLMLDAAAGVPSDAPDTAAIVGWGLARVRRRHADVLEAFYFEGKSIAEIARERSLSERAVEGRLRRARAVLKKTLSRILGTKGEPEHARQTRAS
jgi:RNA polymerase sigma-70 factor (ECF subfamily)